MTFKATCAEHVPTQNATTTAGPRESYARDSVNGSTEMPRAAEKDAAPLAQPIWFGPERSPLFGWFHEAVSPRRDCVVVLCNPFGYDAVLTHYSYRALAERLAATGVAALRFDYFGTGDSSGSDEGPDHIERWLADIEAACLEASRRAAVTATAVFGLGLGGLLALAATQRQPVHDLILLGPPASGRAFLRELRAIRALRTAVPPFASEPREASSEDENFGFLMTEPMRKAIQAIDPKAMTNRTAQRALVIPRDDVSRNDAELAEHLRSCGVDVTLKGIGGYAVALQGDPYTSVLPDEAWGEIVSWLTQEHAVKGDESPSDPLPSGHSLPATTIGAAREEAVRFGGLFGLLTEPTEQTSRSRTGIILIDSGANHRIGNNRLYVTWARSWAACGFRVLRFDLAGIGDSPVPPGRRAKEVYSPMAMPETRAAMDFLERRGCNRFVLGGICSGAYIAFHTAVDDPRVAGILLMNPPTFHWKEGDSLELHTRNTFSSTSFYLRAAMSADTWKKTLR
ncbi:MAG TPA: alpha/beta fold hydrolase, partial [Polyangiaceae bacterium]|nr:alpha/beta fold hydrolase [Polyangiaceae bacterium]